MSRMKEKAAQKGLFDLDPAPPVQRQQGRTEGAATTLPPPEERPPASPAAHPRRRRRKCDVCRNKGVMKVAKITVVMVLASGARYERDMPEHYTKEVVCPECSGDSALPEDH